MARELLAEVGNPALYLTIHHPKVGGRPIDAVREDGSLHILRTLLDERRHGVFA